MAGLRKQLTFRGTHAIKIVMERVLRRVMASEMIDKRYRYNADEKLTQIKIYRGYPKRLENFPTITITAGGFPVKFQAVGEENELASQIKGSDPPSYTSTGLVTIPITLKVFCKGSSDDREILTDILYMVLRILSRGEFKIFGWVNFNVEGEGQFIDIDKEIVFTNSITVYTQSDYLYVTTDDADKLIDQIAIDVIPVVKVTDGGGVGSGN